MDDIDINLEELKLEDTVFKDVRYYVSGHVQEKVLEVLRLGGAERMNYFSDYVTHVVCGTDPDENDLTDATDVYEIPVVTCRWVVTCAKLKRLISAKGFKYDSNQLFSGLVFCFSRLGEDRYALWSLLTYHGGTVHHNFTHHCTHLVTADTKGQKYLKAVILSDRVKIVTPDWVIESVKGRTVAQPELYHPKLLTWPKPRESTALITGFEQDDNEKISDIPETESTQALLDQLKQRMPWNQPTTPTTPSGPFQNFLSPAAELSAAKRLPWTPGQSTAATPATSPYNFNPNQVESPPAKRLPWAQQNNAAFPGAAGPQPDISPVKASMYPGISDSHTDSTVSVTTSAQQQHLFQQQRVQQIRPNLPPPPPQQFPATQPNATVGFSQLSQPIASMQQGANQLPGRPFIGQNQPQPQHMVQPGNQNQYKVQGQIGQPPVQNHPGHGMQPQAGQQMAMISQQQQQQAPLMHGQPQLVQSQRIGQPFGGQAQVAASQQPVQFQMPGQQAQQAAFNQRGALGPDGQLGFAANQSQMQPGQMYGVQSQAQGGQFTLQQQQQKVQQQQRAQMHPNWQQPQQQQLGQQQQLVQQQAMNPQQQLGQPGLNQQQLVQQQQLNQQGLGQSPQINQQLSQQSLSQQQQLTQQQLVQQQALGQPQQLAQQALNQQQLAQQGMSAQQQLNQQPLNPQQLTPQGLNQQPAQQALNPQQLGQQQLNPQQHLAQQQLQQQQLQQQQQLTQQQLNPQQIGQQQQQQQQLTAQQLQQRQQLAQQQQPHLVQQQQQLGQPLNQQQLNQQHLVQQQINVQRHGPAAIATPRLNWSPNQPPGAMPQRQLIHLDAQTHQQLQQMDPQQRALFVAKLQKQRQLLLHRQQLLQQQQRGGHIAVIRGGMPPGLTPQQQMQWLQQQQSTAKPQAIVLPQVNAVGAQHAPGLSPIAQPGPNVLSDPQSQQIQIQRQQFQRLQQLHIQREQAQKQQMQQVQAGAIVRPPMAQQEVAVAPPTPAGTPAPAGAPPTPGDQAPGTAPQQQQQQQQQLVVNAKTKTALANMLSIRLQSGGGNIAPVEGEPSAAGTLRLMTAQHNAALNQTPARPQDLLAMQQQRRTLGNITNAAGELPRTPAPTPVPAGAQPTEANKQQYSPGRVLPLPQHRHGPFYGHNPNLKLPPDLFLLGCIFVVVEVERYLEETSPDWRAVIEKHGGEVEPVYCSRVTHVLCETQRHGVVMQALRDLKRCVTLFWLDDVVKRKQVVPPWQALHLPTGYMDGAPASRHLICLSGFTGNDRSRVRDMIKYTGAKFTSYFSRHNTILVCAKFEGVKYQHAKRWGTPVVNVLWLTDLMLGNFSALHQIEHVKYQQFSQPVQFGFDTALVPNLMFAWKMPINISQESYERVKRSPSPVVLPQKSKKPRLDTSSAMENEISAKETSHSHRVLFSLYSDKDRKSLEKIVLQLGGSLAKSYEDGTHLVMPHLGRSTKLLFALTVGMQIVPDTWLKESQTASKFLDESAHRFDTKEFNATHDCDFYKTLVATNRDKLFQNKVFFLTPSVVPSYKILKELIERSGGTVEKQRRSLGQIEAANNSVPYSYIILTNENDLHVVYDCLRKTKGADKQKYVGSSEVVMMAVLRQSFPFDQFLVRVY